MNRRTWKAPARAETLSRPGKTLQDRHIVAEVGTIYIPLLLLCWAINKIKDKCKRLMACIYIVSDDVHNETDCPLGQFARVRRGIVETLAHFPDNRVH